MPVLLKLASVCLLKSVSPHFVLAFPPEKLAPTLTPNKFIMHKAITKVSNLTMLIIKGTHTLKSLCSRKSSLHLFI